MLKIFGAMLVVAFSYTLGISCSSGSTEKAKAYHLMLYILEELCCGIEKNLKIDEIIQRLKTENVHYDRRTLIKYIDGCPLDDEHKEKMIQLLTILGKSSAPELEEARCKRLHTEIIARISTADKEAKEKKELYSKLGLISGLALCIFVL